MRNQPRYRSSGPGWVRFLVLMLTLTAGLAPEAVAQVSSDYFAYPRTFADIKSARKDSRQLEFNRMPGLSQDYRLGPGDEVEIAIVGHQVLQRRISATGEVSIPYVDVVSIADLTAEEAEAKIAAAFQERQLINEPQVLLTVLSYESKTIYVFGEVDRPGEYSISFQMTLQDLLFVAGGLDFTAGQYGYLHRRAPGASAPWTPAYVKASMADLIAKPGSAGPGSEVIRVDLQPLKSGGVLDRNIVLKNGDVFYIPRRNLEFVYLIGEVTMPGAYELPNSTRVTAAQAIAWAGGTTRSAKVSEGMLVREEGGQRREYAIDFGKLLKGAQPDMEVRPNDVIFIPTAAGKRLAMSILGAIPRVAAYVIVF